MTALVAATGTAEAAPEWGIFVEHHNAYGAQQASCPTAKEEYFPGEPEMDCGVDPFTGSGTTFDRESGFNQYKVTVTNVGAEALGAAIASEGQLLSCAAGTWSNSPTTFAFQWLRDGEPIPGATSGSYRTQPADEGKAVQCLIEASNAGGTSVANASGQAGNPATPVIVAPSPSSPPVPPSSGIAAPTGTVEAGKELTCSAGSWKGVGGSEPYTYIWLRDGVKIAETSKSAATSNKYLLTAESVATAAVFQCEVIASNGTGGAVLSLSANKNSIAPAPSTTPPVVGTSTSRPRTGPLLQLVDHLPEGMTFAEKTSTKEASGSGWTCAIEDSATNAVCERSSAEPAVTLGPGESYPVVTLVVHVGAAVLGTPPEGGEVNHVGVQGGGAPLAMVADPTAISQLPFGIATLQTSVINSAAEPFTQAEGHPYAATASLVLNYEPADDGTLKTAGGSPKNLETELPPGFIGNPQAVPRCSAQAFEGGAEEGDPTTPCPLGSAVGYLHFSYSQGSITSGRAVRLRERPVVPIYNVTPSVGQAASFGFVGGESYAHFRLNARVRADGDYGVTLDSPNTPVPTLLAINLTFCGHGVIQSGSAVEPEFACGTSDGEEFLTNPARCTGIAPQTTIRADTYQAPNVYASKAVYNGSHLMNGQPSVTESFATGCNLLQFAPEVEYGPSTEGGTSQAGQPTGATFTLKVPQTSEPEKPATPELQSATVTLPEGMTADPSAAGGLEACTNAQFGLGSTVEPAEPATCPAASQVGTVMVVTPLLEKPLAGQVFIGSPECSPCSSDDAEQGHLFRLFLQVRLPERGVLVKLAGKVSANPTTGQLQATFTEQPQLPFSELILSLMGGPRAPLANPQTCGSATTTTDLTPWSAPGLGGLAGTEAIEGTPGATPSSSFSVDWDGKGGACPTTLPFSPSFLAQTTSSAAEQYSPLSVSFGRPEPAIESEERDEQNFAGISLNMPEGLLGRIAGVEQCPEAQANAGTCPSSSEIGTATVGAGAGSHPYYLTGHVYLTGPYEDHPFGLSIAVPAEAGPFRLAGSTGTGLEVVRAAIAVNPHTAALSVTSDPLPQVVDGVPLRLHNVRVDVNRPDFMLNPTSCAAGQQIAGIIIGEPVNKGEAAKTASVSAPFAATGCAALPFHPTLTASTSGITSLKSGASLNVTIAASAGEANIGKVDLTLPKALPARLSTLHQACTEAQFDSNPAACPEGSEIGAATARTPLLSNPLSGPVYIVSHGGTEFPDVEMVLQGENGLEILLDGQTQITGGVTYSRFESVPDAPITSFETSLPEGPHSIFGANEDLCTARNLNLGVTATGQSGAQTVQSVPIAVTGCPPATAATPKPTIKIEKTTVSGSTVRVTVKLTAKGRLSLSGADLRTVKRNATAGTVTLTTSLTKTRARRKRRRIRLKLRVGYAPTTGASSSVSTTVTFR